MPVHLSRDIKSCFSLFFLSDLLLVIMLSDGELHLCIGKVMKPFIKVSHGMNVEIVNSCGSVCLKAQRKLHSQVIP